MSEIPWTNDLGAALKQAGEEERFVLLDFFSPT